MTTVGTLQSLQIGTPTKYGTRDSRAPMQRQWETSFYRQPTAQARWLYTTHLEGNSQADKQNHGTIKQAVLCYASTHYPAWQMELELPEIGPGGFGENFTVTELTEQTVRVGDIYAVGEARIQVTGPRYPCWKIARRWQVADLTERVAASGRTGWYCRVLQEGLIEPGMPVSLVERPYPDWTIALLNDLGHRRKQNPELAREIASCPPLMDMWKNLIVKQAQMV